MQAASELSQDLIESICRQSPFSLDRHLSILPAALHDSAAYAAYPSLLSTGDLALDLHSHTTATGAAVLRHVAPLSGAKNFRLSIPYFIPADTPSALSLTSAIEVAVKREGIRDLSLSMEKASHRNIQWLERLLNDINPNTLTRLELTNACTSNHSLYAQPLQRLAQCAATLIDRQPGLQNLTLHRVAPHADESAEHQQLVSEALKGLTGLSRLELDNQFGHPASLASTLQELPQLQSLNITVDWMPTPIELTPGMFFLSGDVMPLCSAIGSMSALTSLTLSVRVSSNLTQHAPAQLLQALIHLPNIVHLDLSGCLITRVPAFWLAALRGMPRLQTSAVNLLEVNDMTATDISSFCSSTASNLTSLRLYVRRRPMPTPVCMSLSRFSQLQSLCIERAEFNAMNTPDLSMNLPLLRKLTMERCVMAGGEGFLARAIKQLTTLTCLELKDLIGSPNTFILAGLRNLVDLRNLVLQSFETTEDSAHFYLVLPPIEDYFVDALDALSTLSSITSLSLRGCKLQDNEVVALSKSLHSLHDLHSLDVCSMQLPTTGHRTALTATLEALTSLKYLALSPGFDMRVTEPVIMIDLEQVSFFFKGLQQLQELDLRAGRLNKHSLTVVARLLTAISSLRSVHIGDIAHLRNSASQSAADGVLQALGMDDPTRCVSAT